MLKLGSKNGWIVLKDVAAIFMVFMLPFAARSAFAADVRMNLIVSSPGKLMSDGKGGYRTAEDFVAVFLDPSGYPQMSFQICTKWPFSNRPLPLVPTSGVAGARTLVHDLTAPVPGGGGTGLGMFKEPGGNDVALSKPLTSRVNSFTDMAVGSSVSPDSAEVRFCNSGCTEYYSLIFGNKSLFYQEMEIGGAGTNKPTVTRTSDTAWTISFPPKTIGRLWKRSGELKDLGLYFYDGTLDLKIQ